jgi:hypothetical protein
VAEDIVVVRIAELFPAQRICRRVAFAHSAFSLLKRDDLLAAFEQFSKDVATLNQLLSQHGHDAQGILY